MRRIFLILLALLLAAPAALAEDVCLIEDPNAGEIRTSCPYIRVVCPLQETSRVTLTIRDGWGGLIYQRDHGLCSGTFRSGEIHLPMDGAETLYRLTLKIGETEQSLRVIRVRPMTEDSSVYAQGLSLADLCQGSRRKYAVLLDVSALREEKEQSFPLIAGGLQIGEAIFRLKGTDLTCETRLTVSGSIEKSKLHIAQDAQTATQLGASRFPGLTGKLGKAIDIGGAPYLAVMIQLTVVYDEASAIDWNPEKEYVLHQQQLWQEMQGQCGANG